MGIRGIGNPVAGFRYRFGRTGNRASKERFIASGGAITYYDGKTIHTFTTSGSFVVSSGSNSIDIVLVGGGGGSGSSPGGAGSGGGGAGGYVFQPNKLIGTGSYDIVIGGAGAASPGYADGGRGGDTEFGTSPQSEYLVAKGGGGAGGFNTPFSNGPGGSGGGNGPSSSSPPRPGGTATQPTQPGNSGTFGLGFPGGTGTAPDGPGSGLGYRGGGGGGAGGAGGDSQPNLPGTGPNAGGASVRLPAVFRDPSNPLGAPNYPNTEDFHVAGGGGGSSFAPSYGGNPGGGGAGGGVPTFPAPQRGGVANTGGGAGGTNTGPTGASGGSGIVLIAYPS